MIKIDWYDESHDLFVCWLTIVVRNIDCVLANHQFLKIMRRKKYAEVVLAETRFWLRGELEFCHQPWSSSSAEATEPVSFGWFGRWLLDLNRRRLKLKNKQDLHSYCKMKGRIRLRRTFFEHDTCKNLKTHLKIASHSIPPFFLILACKSLKKQLKSEL